MLGLIYVLLMIWFGDAICSVTIPFKRWPTRLAAAFLVGFLISTWLTYLAASVFGTSPQPLVVGNILFFVVAIAAIAIIEIRKRRRGKVESIETGPDENAGWTLDGEMSLEGPSVPDSGYNRDWIFAAVFLVASGALMFLSFGFSGDQIRMVFKVWSDFGANLAIVQSFALGSNFPTEYPLFAGEPIRTHFLFWFQGGNLYFLGLHPVWGINLLSILSLTSLLLMIVELGGALFSSRWVGRIAACLFFVHGSLAYFHAIANYDSLANALKGLLTSKNYLVSGFGYHGEDWGLWTLNVYINQRHLITALGIMTLVLAVWARLQARFAGGHHTADSRESSLWEMFVSRLRLAAPYTSIYVFCGMLIGLLPLWNGPVFVTAFGVFGLILLFFPDRLNILALLTASLMTAMPQLIFLRPELGSEQQNYPALFWGFNVVPATIGNVAAYIWYTFGFKLVLMAVGLFLLRRAHRLLFIAFLSLLVLAFTVKFNFEVLTNHKFVNTWLVFANLFAAYGFYQLWRWSAGGKAVAVLLLALIVPGGVLDVLPLYNENHMTSRFDQEPLAKWVIENTSPHAVFLTDHYDNHPFLYSGRKIFQGYTYFTAPAGYPSDKREIIFKEMFTTKNPDRLYELLRSNGIDYVIYDGSLRNNVFKTNNNEEVMAAVFPLVYSNDEPQYGRLRIYQVKEITDRSNLPPVAEAEKATVFQATEGGNPGQLSKPRGLATDKDGNIYVSDTGNSRIEKFAPDGSFLMVFGKAGNEEGEIKEPNGIVVDDNGSVYVADALNNKLVRYHPDGSFDKEWKGADTGFYGPRDIAMGPNKQIYVVDQGRLRIARFDPVSESYTLTWGRRGAEEGEFSEATGIAVSAKFVFVTDTGNERIQVFDLDGKFIRQWPVPEWKGFSFRYPDAVFDERSGRLYVTSSGTNEVLAFDLEGTPQTGIKPSPDKALDNPSALAVTTVNKKTQLLVLNTNGSRVSAFELENAKSK